MRFLLTRPIADSEALAKRLKAKGIPCYIEPLMILDFLPKLPLDFTQYQALIFTSPNGVRAYAHHYHGANLKIYCVGDKAAKMAKSIGFKDVISAKGDLLKLSDTIHSQCTPNKGPLLYLSAKHIAGNLKEQLEGAGFKIDRQQIYQTNALKSLPVTIEKLIENDEINYIPFYSSRSALIFIELIKKAALENCLSNISALCLSPAVRAIIEPFHWKEIITADKPTQYDLFNKVNIEL